MTTMTFDEPVLSQADEHRLARAIEAGLLARHALEAGTRPAGASADDLAELRRQGEEAYQRFIRANLRLVAMVTFRTAARASLDVDDLFQEGVLGLLEALRRYDHTRGARFASFALPWIRMRVGELAVTRCGVIGLPASRAKAWAQAVAIRDALSVALGRQPTLAEIAEYTGRPVEQVRALLGYVPAARVADAESWADSGRGEARVETDPLALRRMLRRLSLEERAVVDRLYGLGGRGVLGYDEIAQELGVSISTVRRRERNALDRMRGREAGRVVA